MAYDKHVHKYFKTGDIVKCEAIWGDQLFIVHGFGGNAYLPELYVHFYGKPQTISNTCNFDLRMAKLVDSLKKRPFKKLDNEIILKMLKKDNKEAKRELMMRNKELKKINN